ncbi:hypothetical protein EXIGLDRAFT_766928 [Exidia glandulosa HHB12029]|uniref:Uncharacterized protein n=1 Tax=Exidia glandulosa HHB12029 TaxID=1314781 RepID=A0A165JCB2_EXIGL|nr:hypothetical protein EXIGLDRAFT_766928 [Exidia glandulosa HHB12029]
MLRLYHTPHHNPTPNWDDLPSISLFFPNVETLIIGSHPHAPEPLCGDAQVICPALKRLEIQGLEWDQRDVSVEELAEYMVNKLGCVPPQNLSLTLRRMFLLGDHGVIQGYFKEITIV